MTASLLPTLIGPAATLLLLAAAGSRRPATTRVAPLTRGPTHDQLSKRPGRRPLRQRATVLAAAAVAFVVAPPLTALPPLLAWLRTRRQALRAQRAEERRIAEALPEAVDLLLLCTSAGWSLPVAHPQVARRIPPPVGAALSAAAVAADRGQPRADALLEVLTPLGDRARALGQVLADHLHYGVALTPGLERLGLELRLDRRRRAELEARRVPVRLLGPLVLCVLPAFALLTVVPLLVASLQGLPT